MRFLIPIQAYDYFKKARFQEIRACEGLLLTALEFSADQTEGIVLYLCIQDDRIVQAQFKAANCWAMIACGAWLREKLQGCALSENFEKLESVLIESLQLPAHKWYCAQMTVAALHKIKGRWQDQNKAAKRVP
ncbi:MAG: iron-sulfur cluster assembly scaffold protein [Saprospiraceae bacterium]|nr:iron-sulfur cluster assembly scaffold protein [Saprospiraceae bacterium]